MQNARMLHAVCYNEGSRGEALCSTPNLEIMETLSQRFSDLLERMQETDDRMQALIEKHLDSTRAHLADLKRITDEAPND